MGTLTLRHESMKPPYMERTGHKKCLSELAGFPTVWDSDREEWYFSIVDVIAILTEQPTHQGARNYWKVLKNRMSKEGNETVTNCNRLKLPAEDGKMRLTDVADTEQLFRLIQSIPSPKAEPFKLWMAQVAKERLDQLQDPELSIEQAMLDYKRLGYSDNWINQRLKSIEIRKDLTDEPTTNRMQSQACLSYAEMRRRKAKPMETSWIAGRGAICNPDGHYL